MAVTQVAQACDLVIFGAKNDLARRKSLPPLYQLKRVGQINPNTRIIGVGRINWDKIAYTKVVREALETFMKEKVGESLWEILNGRFEFCDLDVNDTAAFKRLGKMLDQKSCTIIDYSAMPSSTFGAICKGLGEAKLNAKPIRVVIEKPLGTSLATSREINDQVGEYFEECQVYHIDHHLGKEAMLNLLVLRFVNSLFTNNWDNHTIDHVEITVAEEVGIKGCWGYFDQAGQMRDMIQNHLLQILCMITMSPPPNPSVDSICDEKVKVLKSLHRIDRSSVREETVRGQCTAGFTQGKKVSGCLKEKDVNKSNNAETSVTIRVDVDNQCWAGVPFCLCIGKRLPIECPEVVAYFKTSELSLFRESWQDLPQNKLTIRLQPDEGVDIQVLNKVPGPDHKHNLQITRLDLSYSETFSRTYLTGAYECLLLETMRSTQALFVRRDEVEGARKWVDSITEA